MKYLTIATCIKMEDDYIDDFVLIHEKLGAEHFIFFDRDGDNLTNKFRGKDNITVVKYPEPNRHHHSHLHVINHFQGFSRWVAFIDCDQVLFSPINADVRVTLQEFERHAQVQPVWETFGDNHHLTKTEGSVYKRFTRRAKSDAGINNHTQGVADISRAARVVPPDPHRILVVPGQFSVDENHRDIGVTPHIVPHTQNKLFVAHYISKSKEEWIYKNNKLRADTGTRMDPSLFEGHQKFCNEVEDFRIKEFWENNCQ
jgi:hypothetical protein